LGDPKLPMSIFVIMRKEIAKNKSIDVPPHRRATSNKEKLKERLQLKRDKSILTVSRRRNA